MQVFECRKEGGRYSLNFVDENDVFVGFDDAQKCCEHWDYTISFIEDLDKAEEDTPSHIDENWEGLEGYVFDTEYSGSLYGSFKLEKKGCPNIYLHLFNEHNGYYAHGFEMVVDGKVKVEGYL